MLRSMTVRRYVWVACSALVGLLAASPVAHAQHYQAPYHLTNLNGHSQPTIWFVDYTDSSWPVTAAADEWDRSSKLTAGRRASCPHAGDYCPPVYQVPSNPYWFGLTTYQLNSAGTHISRYNFYLQLSNSAPLPTRGTIACHELGHALGLKHRQPSQSCMYPSSLYELFYPLPDSHDFNQLWNVYSHTH